MSLSCSGSQRSTKDWMWCMRIARSGVELVQRVFLRREVVSGGRSAQGHASARASGERD